MFKVSFFVEDVKLGEALKRLAGIARNVEHAYVPNVGPANGASVKITGKDRQELIQKELHRRGKPTIMGPEFKGILEKLGIPTASYSHDIGTMMKAGYIKQGKKIGNALQYIVTGK